MQNLDEFIKQIEEKLGRKITPRMHGNVTGMFIRKFTVEEVVNLLMPSTGPVRERLGGDGDVL